MNKRIGTLLLALAAGAACAQVLREPASPALMEHFQKAIANWDRGPVAPPGSLASPQALQAVHEVEFLKTRQQLRQMGTSLFPLAPRVADQLQSTQKNQYALAFILMDIVPAPGDAEVPGLVQRAGSGQASERLVAIAQLARSSSAAAFEAVRAAARDGDAHVRLMGTVGLGFAGKSFPEVAAQSVAPNLKDGERYVRSAAANSLRLIGAPSAAVAPQVIDYLRTKENVYQAVSVLKVLPVSVVRPAKADLEAVVSDAKLTSFQKQDAVDLLVKMQSTD